MQKPHLDSIFQITEQINEGCACGLTVAGADFVSRQPRLCPGMFQSVQCKYRPDPTIVWHPSLILEMLGSI